MFCFIVNHLNLELGQKFWPTLTILFIVHSVTNSKSNTSCKKNAFLPMVSNRSDKIFDRFHPTCQQMHQNLYSTTRMIYTESRYMQMDQRVFRSLFTVLYNALLKTKKTQNFLLRKHVPHILYAWIRLSFVSQFYNVRRVRLQCFEKIVATFPYLFVILIR